MVEFWFQIGVWDKSDKDGYNGKVKSVSVFLKDEMSWCKGVQEKNTD